VKPQGLCCIYRIREGVLVQRFLLQLAKLAAGCSLVFVAACATKTASDDFVEVSNPYIGASPGAPATIWVPRSSVEGSAVPRASVLVEKGASKLSEVMGSSKPDSNEVASAPASSQVQPVPAVVPVQTPQLNISPKRRIAVLEVKDNGLILPLSNKLEHLEAGILLDRHLPSFMGKYSAFPDRSDWGAFSVRMQREFGANVSVFVSAPDRIAPGKIILGAVYDGFSGYLVRTVEAQMPSYTPPADPSSPSSALNVALDELAGKLKSVIAFLPWYGRVVSVDNDRVYINAGSETGLKLGQLLKVYRGGKVVPGVGFALGERVAIVEIRGFVGADGAFGVVKEGKTVQVDDLIAVE
jgi:hypothetical protein